MKKIGCCILCFMMFLVSGCSSYERDENPGQLINLTVDELQNKVDEKESFAIVFTQTTCEHCIKFHEMLEPYLLYHNITLYEVVLDEAPQEERKGNLKQINKTFDLESTPSFYYVEKGKVEDKVEGGIEEEEFDDWVVQHQLDEVKK